LRRFRFHILYSLGALALSVFLLIQMNHYLHIPGRGTWNKVAKVIKKDWKKDDALVFSPSWLSGYAMSRRRYLKVIRPDQLVKKGDLESHDSVWLVEAWGDKDGPRTPAGYLEKSVHQFGLVWVVHLEK